MDGYKEIVSKATPEIQNLADWAKAMILVTLPDVVEVAWPKQNIVSYGVGPMKMSEHFCHIGVFKNDIHLGFYYGEELQDPDNLLQGTGKLLRHIENSQVDKLENPAL